MSNLENYINLNLKEKINDDFYNLLDSKYLYHNLHHTERVIKSAIKIGSDYGLKDSEWKVLLTACLLHDYGFIKSHVDHEEIGAELSESILKDYGYSKEEISSVQSLILITKAIAIPNNNLEAIIRDSDLEYLGSNDFEYNRNRELRIPIKGKYSKTKLKKCIELVLKYNLVKNSFK